MSDDAANMRAQGVRSLRVVCDLCHHEAVINVDRFGEDVPVPAFGPRMICTHCGIIGAFAPAELAGAADGRELDRTAVELRPEATQDLKMVGTGG